MKLIHLSDLHIGKRVNEISMLPDQNYILAQILSIVDEEKPDAVLIAGDVYDKTVPPAEAVTLFDDFLCLLHTETPCFPAVVRIDCRAVLLDTENHVGHRGGFWGGTGDFGTCH